MATKYLDYAGLQRLVENIDRKYAPISAIVFKNSVDDIAHLPALNTQKAGWMYNIKTGGLTTSDFVEGAGHVVADGENIAAVELLTGVYTQVGTVAPDADPKALGWYEEDVVTFTDVTASLDPSDDPSALGLYVVDATAPEGYSLTSDNTVVPGTNYFERSATYKLSTDRLPVSGKAYFTADTVMKWDLMGGVFDLEDRYLEFGDQFPQGPATRLVDGRTFLYMGDNKKVYTKVATPEGRPNENGYFELDTATAITDISTIYNPKQQVLYEQDATDPSAVFYVASTDVTYDNTKTYYDCTFVASTDTTVDASKIYYSEADKYNKAIIYQYDATAQDWVAQSSGGTGDMVPITTAEVDELFI